MAKNITVKTDGTAVQYSGVKTLKTSNPEGGSTTWIPLDETRLAIKTVKKNGIYKAKDDGYYGYEKFTVSAKGTTGKKPNGKTYHIDTDEDGWLTETLLPDNIKITTNPTKISYTDGESISLSGAVIKAYSGTDLWEGDGYSGGVIPNSEIALNPDKATYSGGGGANESTLNGVTAYYTTEPIIAERPSDGRRYVYTGADFVVPQLSSNNLVTLYFVASPNNKVLTETETTSGSSSTNNITVNYSTNAGTAFGFVTQALNLSIYNLNISEINDNTSSWFDLISAVLDGEGGGSSQEVTAKWERPDDGEELTDTFDITVSGASS